MPAIDGAALLLALEKEQFDVLRYLLGEDFNNVWGLEHLNMVLDVIFREKYFHLLNDVLGSVSAKNIFLALPERRKVDFIKALHQLYSFNETYLNQARLALSQ